MLALPEEGQKHMTASTHLQCCLVFVCEGAVALRTDHVEGVQKPRKGPNSWTRRATNPCQFQVTSPKRTSQMVPNMELPNGNECTTRPRRCGRKLANPNMVVTKNILDRWHKDDTYRKSLSDIGWIDEQIIQCDDLALEDHSYIATREE